MSDAIVNRLALMKPAEREDHKKTMLKLYSAAKKLTPAEAQAKLKRSQEEERWEKAEESWKITRTEARHRARNVREILEDFRNQIEGAFFDVPCGDVPRSLDHERQDVFQLVENLNPLVNGLFKMIDDLASQHGCDDVIEFNAKLLLLEIEAAETGFQIGVLAGAIFAGCSQEQIDKFERGLTFAMASHRRMVKD